MENLDKDYWTQRYLEQQTGWDLGEVSTPLKHYFDQLTRKDACILIPGAGNAYEAEYLHKNGFSKVHVCDLSAEPLENLRTRCPDFNADHLILGDFFDLEENKYDLIIEQTFFCALKPSLRSDYFKKMHALLKPGGKLVGLLFNDKLNEDKPPFGGNAAEYRTYFELYFDTRTFDLCHNSIAPRAGRELFMVLQKK